MKNPFQFGGTLRPETIVNRQSEIKQIIQTIQDSEKLFLIGPRRYGKTTILHAARQTCEARGGRVFYVNAEAYNNLPELTARLFASATESLIRFPLKAKTTIREALSRFKSTLSVDPLTNKVTGSLSFDAAAREQPMPLLVEALNLIEQLASEQKQPVGIIIDEFQAIILEGGEKAEGQIRAAIQDHHHVGYVFAGSRTRMLADMTNDHSRPFYRLGTRRMLKEIPTAEVIAWLIERFAQGGYHLTEVTAEYLLARAEAVPYDIQKIAKACWTLLGERGERIVTPSLIEAACQMLLEEDGDIYLRAWNQLPATQKRSLVEVRRQGGRE
ncbi:MAG TPA: ATP-binding protein, partial [Blastocatellia bacterium]|nr:ATP-binding protein [Blastocatellia bacterium]